MTVTVVQHDLSAIKEYQYLNVLCQKRKKQKGGYDSVSENIIQE